MNVFRGSAKSHWLPLTTGMLVAIFSSVGCASAEEEESVDSSNLTDSSAVYHVQIDWKEKDGSTVTRRCTGFLVSRSSLITASHCFPNALSNPGFSDQRIQAWNVVTKASLGCNAHSCALGSMLRDRDVAKINVSAPAGAATVRLIDADYTAKNGKSVPSLSFYTNSRPGSSPAGWSMKKVDTSGKLSQAGSSSTFKIFLTGTNTVLGDSGGPLFDAQGRVVGSIVSQNEATYFGMSAVRSFVLD
ncbi:MAG: serine protease [Polyangiaceae bacterium]